MHDRSHTCESTLIFKGGAPVAMGVWKVTGAVHETVS